MAQIPVPIRKAQFIHYNAALQTVDVKTANRNIRSSINDPTQRFEFPLDILFTRDEDAAPAATFEQAWADVNDRYYVAAHKNGDWKKIGDKYRAYLPSIAGHLDLERLIASMFGELSASHLFTGITQPNSALIGMGTRNDALGIYLDDAYTGAG